MRLSESLKATRTGLGPFAVPVAVALVILLLALLGPLAAPHDPLAVNSRSASRHRASSTPSAPTTSGGTSCPA